jgi:hypothetical protein
MVTKPKLLFLGLTIPLSLLIPLPFFLSSFFLFLFSFSFSFAFADEPTTGLDSQNSLRVMKALRRLCALGHSIVACLHSPRSTIFFMFDYLMLLAKGQVVYYGPVAEVLGYFDQELKCPCPRFVNPADFLVDLIEQEEEEEEAQQQDQSDKEKKGDEQKKLISEKNQKQPLKRKKDDDEDDDEEENKDPKPDPHNPTTVSPSYSPSSLESSVVTPLPVSSALTINISSHSSPCSSSSSSSSSSNIPSSSSSSSSIDSSSTSSSSISSSSPSATANPISHHDVGGILPQVDLQSFFDKYSSSSFFSASVKQIEVAKARASGSFLFFLLPNFFVAL